MPPINTGPDYVLRGWGIRLIHSTHPVYLTRWQLELTFGSLVRVICLNDNKPARYFRNFRECWTFRWRPDHKHVGTPFFCVSRYRGKKSVFLRDGYITGWLIAAGPARWKFDFSGGDPLYRWTWDTTRVEYRSCFRGGDGNERKPDRNPREVSVKRYVSH